MTTRVTKLSILSRCRLVPLNGRVRPSGRRGVSGHMQKAVLTAIAGREGEPLSVGSIAEMAGCSVHGATCALWALRNEGFVEIVGPVTDSNVPYSWRISWDKLADLVPELAEVAA